MLLLLSLGVALAAHEETTCSEAIARWLTRANDTVSAAHASCAADISCSAHVLGPRESDGRTNVWALLRETPYGDVPAAVCGELGDTEVGAQLLSLWLVAQMLKRRDLCPRGFEHVFKKDTFQCECLLGNQCDDYFNTDSDLSNTERVLFWVSAISSVILLVLGFIRFVVVYNRTVPHDHHHAASNTK